MENDETVREAEEQAAAEAAGIGGDTGQPERDPAEQPVAEAGGGVSEGFEDAEQLMQERAEHGERSHMTGFPPEAESDRSTASYGEADEFENPDS